MTAATAAATSWAPEAIGDWSGRRAAVTGVTSGLGTRTALGLAQAGAEVVLLARNPEKLADTRRTLSAEVPGATFHPVVCDLADQASVREAAPQVAELGPLHLLVNNAGVMATPYARTSDGFELQMATNHFGHFALTGLVMDQLVASGGARVVSVSSNAHRLTRSAPLGDPRDSSRRYSRWDTYAKSKLANLLFAFELDRRAREAGLPLKALGAHPGYSGTGLITSTLGRLGRGLPGKVVSAGFHRLGQPPELGAWCSLMAATADLPGATYVGPSGIGEWRGAPQVVRPRPLAHDAEAQRRLWEVSQDVTGVIFP